MEALEGVQHQKKALIVNGKGAITEIGLLFNRWVPVLKKSGVDNITIAKVVVRFFLTHLIANSFLITIRNYALKKLLRQEEFDVKVVLESRFGNSLGWMRNGDSDRFYFIDTHGRIMPDGKLSLLLGAEDGTRRMGGTTFLNLVSNKQGSVRVMVDACQSGKIVEEAEERGSGLPNLHLSTSVGCEIPGNRPYDALRDAIRIMGNMKKRHSVAEAHLLVWGRLPARTFTGNAGRKQAV